jgi:hypothetical protein
MDDDTLCFISSDLIKKEEAHYYFMKGMLVIFVFVVANVEAVSKCIPQCQ